MQKHVWAILILLLLITAVWSLPVSALNDETKPIPNGPSARTWNDFYKVSLRHNQRVIVGSYKRMGMRNPKWDTAALSFLNSFTRWYASRDCGLEIDANTIIKQGKAASDQGCIDPIVMTCLAVMLVDNGSHSEAIPLLQRGLADFHKIAKLPRDIARLAPIYLIKLTSIAPGFSVDEINVCSQLAVKWTSQSVREGSYLPDESRVLYHMLNECSKDFSKENLRSLFDAVGSAPKPDKYAVSLLGGLAEIKEAWVERGNEDPYAVTKEGHIQFGHHLVIARELLTKAWKLHPEYPEAPTAIIAIAREGFTNRNDTPRRWFDRAVAAQMDYGPAYDEMHNSLLYYRDLLGLYEFGVDCLNTKRFDTGVPWRFLKLLWAIQSMRNGNKTYWVASETTQHLSVLYDGYEKSGFLHGKDFYRSMRAATAWYCGRSDEAKKILSELGNKLNKSVFHDFFHVDYAVAKDGLDRGVVMGLMALNPENGHYYELRTAAQKITWIQAKSLAELVTYESFKGHLATISSQSEEAFIRSLGLNDKSYWTGAYNNNGAWQWVTSEPWSYSNVSETGIATSGERGAYIRSSGLWDVFTTNTIIDGYVVECE